MAELAVGFTSSGNRQAMRLTPDGALVVTTQGDAVDLSTVILDAPATTPVNADFLTSSTGFRLVEARAGLNLVAGTDLIAVAVSSTFEDYAALKTLLDAIDTDQGTVTGTLRAGTFLLRTLDDVARIVTSDDGLIKTIGAKTIVGTARDIYVTVGA